MGRANNFDCLRIVAATMVVISHQFALMGYAEPLLTEFCSMGGAGVLVFFGISGFLVSESWRRDPDLGRFLAKRFLRILPGLAVCWPLVELVIYLTGSSNFPGNVLHAHNGSLWTIKMEVLCYLLLAGAAMLTRHPAVLMTTCLLIAWQFAIGQEFYLAMFGVAFGFGMLLSAYPRLRSGEWMVAFVILSVAAYLLHLRALCVVLLIPPLAVWIGNKSWPAMRDAGRFGDFSYGVYIYAWPTQQLLLAWMGEEQPYLMMLALSLAIIYPLGALSWWLVEKPALRAKPSRIGSAISLS